MATAVKTNHTSLVIGLVLCLTTAGTAVCQQPSLAPKVYRGSIGGKNIEMRLNVQGANVSGSYSYDSIGEALQVTGHLDEQGRLELAEFVNKKQTGKFACRKSLDDPMDSECTWSRPDGTRQAFVRLEEQHVAFTNGFQVVPRTIAVPKSGIRVSYPQIANGGKGIGPGAEGFNRRVISLVQKAVKEFEPGSEAGRNSFETNYSVLLAIDDVISVEMREYSDSGGAHPNTAFWSVTYDLSGNKELELDSLFKPDSDYKMAIAKYVVADIDKRADALEQDEAKREGRKPNPRDEPITSIEQLSEISDWSMTPFGLVVYFDFPHAISVFDKNFVPYSVLKNYLKPNTPASRFINSSSPPQGL
jgi:hypothetical protein